MDHDEGPKKASRSRAARSSALATAGEDERLRIRPAKNRLLQVNGAPNRKLFDKARKELFLEWFAATCNTRLSAGKAGVNETTIYKHLQKDEAFAEACRSAVQLAYFRLEARELQEAHRPAMTSSAAEPPHPAPAEAGVDPLPQGGEGYEVRILDDELAEEHFNPELALQLLREHRRHLPGSGAGRPAQRTSAQSATNKEIAEALAKRLKTFAVRHGSGPRKDRGER